MFKSTAEFYSRYRVPYPKSLIAQLEIDATLHQNSVVLDLATGPGRLALRLAPSVNSVVAVDVESEMLQEGRIQARNIGVRNINWIQSKAEDLEIDQNSIDLVTVGEAIHRLDQELVLRRIRYWLRKDACVAIVGCFGVLHGESPWQKSLRIALKKWSNRRPQDNSQRWRGRGEEYDTARLTEAGFHRVLNRTFSIQHIWTKDSILGNLHSTSQFSLSALDDELSDFDQLVMSTLNAHEKDQFSQTIPCGYTIGWNRSSVVS